LELVKNQINQINRPPIRRVR